MAVKLPALASTLTPWAGTCRRLAVRVASTAGAAADGDQRHLGAVHGTEDQGCQRREDDAGKLSRGRRAMNGEASCR